MVFSARKPYQRTSLGVREFYRAPARNLKDSIGPESVFEKPYQTKEYGDMHQSMNIPTIDLPAAVGGELVCLYNRTNCEVFASCYAGGAIKVDGGPEEAGAGYVDPVVIKGELANWYVAEDQREIHLTFDPNVDQNVIEVGFVDGWGVKHTQTLDSTCSPWKDCEFTADDDFEGADGEMPDSTRWTRTVESGTVCKIYTKGFTTGYLFMYSSGSGRTTLTHNTYFGGDTELTIEHWPYESNSGQVERMTFRVRNIVNNHTFYISHGYVSTVTTMKVKTFDGSTTSTIFSDSDGKYWQGKIRISRSGSTVTAWWAPSGTTSWVNLVSWAGFGSGAIKLRIAFGPLSTSYGSVHFDNFVVVGGDLLCV